MSHALTTGDKLRRTINRRLLSEINYVERSSHQSTQLTDEAMQLILYRHYVKLISLSSSQTKQKSYPELGIEIKMIEKYLPKEMIKSGINTPIIEPLYKAG